MNTCPIALIAEDEPLLVQALQRELLSLWPTLQIVTTTGDGISAVALALQHQPDVLFFDIRMPGQSGLEAAAELADCWPENRHFPLLVFVTAFDEYAIAAFEAQAVDYLLKPVRPDRLLQTVRRLQTTLKQRCRPDARPPDLEPVLGQLRILINASNSLRHHRLQLLQASAGRQLHMVPVDQVILLEAADKYVRVLTRDEREFWLRTPLKELLDGLDPEVFWQIHRSTVVRVDAIASVSRDDSGQWLVQLGPQRYKVGRLFAHRFRAM